MKTGRIELRVDVRVRAQLEDLAGDMQCGISEVLRRLIADEHGKRVTRPATTSMTSTASTPTAITLEEAGPAAAMLIEMGMTPEELGIAV